MRVTAILLFSITSYLHGAGADTFADPINFTVGICNSVPGDPFQGMLIAGVDQLQRGSEPLLATPNISRVNFKFDYFHTDCDADKAQQAAIHFAITRPNVIFGCYCSTVSEIVAKLGTALTIPQISWVSAAFSLTQFAGENFKYFMRTISPLGGEHLTVVAVLKYFEYRLVKSVYVGKSAALGVQDESSGFSRTYEMDSNDALRMVAAEAGIEVISVMLDSTLIAGEYPVNDTCPEGLEMSPMQPVCWDLTGLKAAVRSAKWKPGLVYILNVHQYYETNIMMTRFMHQEGLTKHFWIAMDAIYLPFYTEYLYPDCLGAFDGWFASAPEQAPELPPVAERIMSWWRDTVTNTSYLAEMSSEMRAAVAAKDEEFRTEGKAFAEESWLWLVNPAAQVDALLTIYAAVGQLLADGAESDQLSGLDLFEAMMAVSFEGAGGHVAFNAQGDPKFAQPESLVNYHSQNYHPVGRVAEGIVEFFEGVEIVWVNNGTGPPPGLAPACGLGEIYDGSDCASCGAGQYLVPEFEGYQCLDCPPGKAGVGVCERCPLGYYAPEPGLSECLACPAGFKCSSYGLDEPVPCPAGTFNDGSLCEGCLPGVCKNCDKGYYTNTTETTECLPCPLAHRCSAFGTVEPQPCPPGLFNNATTPLGHCLPCEAGFYNELWGQQECTQCPAGTFCNTRGLSAPQPCALGSFAGTPGGVLCTSCPAGRYAGREGQSACDSCVPEGSRLPHMWMSLSELQGVEEWVPKEGASSEQDCGCKSGSYLKDGDCHECSMGMICNGNRDILLEPGFFASVSEPWYVWQCFAQEERCPGGLPGSCARNRDNTSLACTSCVPGFKPSGDGSCDECSGTDAIPMIVVLIGGCVGLSVMYYMLDTEDRTRKHRAGVIILLAAGQMVTVYQQLGVMAVIHLAWPAPVSELFRVITLINFDVNVLPVECVSNFSAVVRFAGRVLMVFGVFGFLFMVHLAVAFVRFRGNILRRLGSLWSSIGTILMALLLSIVSGLIAPLQCQLQPNGLYTMRSDDSIVCWDSAYGTSHRDMVIVALFAVLMPLAFVAVSAHAVLMLPSRLSRGDTDFLHRYFFLFSRFKLSCHWYVLVFMLRNMLVGLVPVLPSISTQWCSLHLLLILSLIGTSVLKPWRFFIASMMDIFFVSCLLIVAGIGALLLEGLDRAALGMFVFVILFAVMVVFVGLIMMLIYERLFRQGKPYAFFVCHHKAGCGILARLVKIHLVGDKRVRRKVFVDSDDLSDLHVLFSQVQSEVDTLLVLCSKEILQRPWCVGEITTAFRNQVSLVRVVLPGFVAVDADGIAGYSTMASMLMLAEHGLTIAMIQDALLWLNSTPRLMMPTLVSNACVAEVLDRLLTRNFTRGSIKTAGTVVLEAEPLDILETASLIFVDNESSEAMCAACVVQKLLLPLLIMTNCGTKDLHIHCWGMVLPNELEQVIIICTNGVFEKSPFLDSLQLASEQKADFFCVVVQVGFQYPSEEFYDKVRQAVRADCCDMPEEAQLYNCDLTTRIIAEIFTEIAVDANMHDSETIIRVRMKSLAHRLRDRKGKNRGSRVRGEILQSMSVSGYGFSSSSFSKTERSRDSSEGKRSRQRTVEGSARRMHGLRPSKIIGDEDLEEEEEEEEEPAEPEPAAPPSPSAAPAPAPAAPAALAAPGASQLIESL